jgi:hypothetical protein
MFIDFAPAKAMYSAALTCALLALASCQLAIAFRFTQNINFSQCVKELITLIMIRLD